MLFVECGISRLTIMLLDLLNLELRVKSDRLCDILPIIGLLLQLNPLCPTAIIHRHRRWRHTERSPVAEKFLREGGRKGHLLLELEAMTPVSRHVGDRLSL